MSLDLDEEDRPMTLTRTDFLSISQIPNTSSLQVDLLLPEYELKDGQYQGGRTKFSIIFDIDVIQRIHGIFGDYTDIVAYTDGSSIKNPGRVMPFILTYIERLRCCLPRKAERHWNRPQRSF